MWLFLRSIKRISAGVSFKALAAAKPPNPAPTMIILGCDISSSIQFSRSGTRASGTNDLSAFIFERQQHARAVCLHFAVLDSHVRLYNLCHAQIPQRAPGGLHSILRRVFPGLRTRSDDLHDFVNRVSNSSLFRHDSLLSLVLPTPHTD